MADQQAGYTGAQYSSDFYQKEGESIFDYMRRLASMRSQGILGGGGMLDAAPRKPSVVEQVMSGVPLGQLQLNTSSDSSSGAYRDTRTEEERMRDAVRNLSEMGGADTVKDVALKFMPFGGMLGNFIDYSDWKTVEKALKDKAYSDDQIKQVKENPYMLADLYATGGLVANPLLDGFNVEEAGTGLFHQIGTIPDRLSAAFKGETYDPRQVAATKVFAAPQYMGFDFGTTPAMADAPTGTSTTIMSDSGSTPISVYTPSQWSAEDTSSWDTSGKGTNADGSYDISSWFSG